VLSVTGSTIKAFFLLFIPRGQGSRRSLHRLFEIGLKRLIRLGKRSIRGIFTLRYPLWRCQFDASDQASGGNQSVYTEAGRGKEALTYDLIHSSTLN